MRQPTLERHWVLGEEFMAPCAWLADGPTLVYQVFDAAGRGSLWIRSFAADEPARRLGPEHASEWGAVLSPGGRLLAFASDANRRMEIYVRNLDDEAGAAVRVSLDGGGTPAWRGDGRELYYLDDVGRIVAVPFESLDPPRPGTPVPLFEARVEESADSQFDVTTDGQRFILNRTLVTDTEPIKVVLGWQERIRTSDSR
jgi:hypothetical protein